MKQENPIVWAWWGWEPLPFYLHYKKNAPGLLNSNEGELRKWYHLIHEESTVKAAADLGINCIVTHFIKGFGLAHETEDVKLTAQLVEKCHRHGIKVFGYIQYGSIFHETFYLDYPDAQNWIQINEDGTPLLWCNSKSRYMPCIESQEYLAYLKERIRQGILEVGLDGLHFDNFYARPCYCQHCRDAYRKACNAELPTTRMMEEAPYSPEVRRWVRYRCEKLNQRMIELRDYARSLKHDVMTIWNPSPIRGLLDQRMLRATDVCLLGKNAGFIWSESGNFPGIGEHGPIHQVNFFKTAAAVGYRTFSTVWKSSTEGIGLPETKEEVALVNAETGAFGAETGNNWLMRPHYMHQFPEGELCQEWKRQVDFIRKNRQLFTGSRGKGEIALFFDREQAELDFPYAYKSFLSLQQMLLQNHITFDLLFSGQEAQFQNYALIISAATGQPDIMTFSREELNGDISGSYQAFVVQPARSKELIQRILDALPSREITVIAPEHVFIERRIAQDGTNILHLVNYDNTHPIPGIDILFNNPPSNIKRHSPEGNSTVRQNGRTITLPALHTWAILTW
ncbi:MAG: hypothetical protein IKS20_02140 [Victivallales bacterium]|nr:hypothetical protein [Victivallales bacterium]